jgi:hypothetical protein
MRIREEDIGKLPRHLRSQLVSVLDPQRPRVEADGASAIPRFAVRHAPSRSVTPPVNRLRDGKMSKTEQRYQREVLHGAGLFEAITLKLPGGSRYTADFLTIDDGVPTLHEVKGAYRLGSEGRAHTAFLEAAASFSSIFRFVWATFEKGGRWSMKAIIDRQPPERSRPDDALPEM